MFPQDKMLQEYLPKNKGLLFVVGLLVGVILLLGILAISGKAPSQLEKEIEEKDSQLIVKQNLIKIYKDVLDIQIHFVNISAVNGYLGECYVFYTEKGVYKSENYSCHKLNEGYGQ